MSSASRIVRLAAATALMALVAACASFDADDRGLQPIPPRLVSEMKSKGMSPKDPVFIRIYKQESELELWKRDRTGRYSLLKTYPLCRWSGKLGRKTQEGDRQAPEGFYSVTPQQMNPRSRYFLSFDLGFPNRLEKALGYSGGDLMVHGACTSSGCYAATDAGVAQIYAVVREAFAGGQQSVQVQALPFRMTPANFARHGGNPNLAFWSNLKQGVDSFDATRQPPRIAYCESRYAFNIEAGEDPSAPCPPGTPAPGLASHIAFAPGGDASLAYTDGGMHATFREILRTSGRERLSKMTSERAEVSRPDAALADPFSR